MKDNIRSIEDMAQEIHAAAAMWSAAVACSLREAVQVITACVQQFERMADRQRIEEASAWLTKAFPQVCSGMKNTNLQREDWRGHGKRRARWPR